MTEQPTNRPNIIICLVDDLGFSDLGSYGSRLLTRNIDRLAENGIRCTQMYNSARCCPSRAALWTDRALPASGRRRAHDRRLRHRQLPRFPQRQVCHHRRSAAHRRLPHADERQVACRRQLPPSRARIRLTRRRRRLPHAEAARLRPLLRHLGRLHVLLQSRLARSRRYAHQG